MNVREQNARQTCRFLCANTGAMKIYFVAIETNHTVLVKGHFKLEVKRFVCVYISLISKLLFKKIKLLEF